MHDVINLTIAAWIYGPDMAAAASGKPTPPDANAATPYFPPSTNISADVVLVACGSYNPPTFMHLRMFERARDYLHRVTNYRVIEGVISVVNDAYTKKELLLSKHRLAMLRLALETSDWIRVDDWEAQQKEWTPTVTVLKRVRDQTLNRLSQMQQQAEQRARGPSSTKKQKTEETSEASNMQKPKSSTTHLRVMLLCGSDLLQSFSVPGLWLPEHMEEIVRDFGVVVVSRSGYDPRNFVYETDILSRHEANIYVITEWIVNDVSSTKIRRALQRSESVRYLIADKVLDYIFEHKLYGCIEPHLRAAVLAKSEDASSATTTTKATPEEPHCSYHPQYKPPPRKSINDESDYDNLSPCPCPSTISPTSPSSSFQGPVHQLVRQKHVEGTPPPLQEPALAAASTAAKTIPPGRISIEDILSIPPVPEGDHSQASLSSKPSRFPTDLNGGPATSATSKSTAIKSALKTASSPPTTARQRAVSYHSDLSRSLQQSSLSAGGSKDSDTNIPFASVAAACPRSLSNLSEVRTGLSRDGQWRQDPAPAALLTPNAKRENGGAVGPNGEEEVAWLYDPELTKSMPNLRLRHTPPRHVRIMDRGACFTHDGVDVTIERRSEERRFAEETPHVSNNLVVRVKQLKLTMSPETTV